MKKIIQPKFKDPLYSLHDAHVTKMECRENSLLMTFDYGYISTEAPYEQVQGQILLENPDWDFCHAYIMEYPDTLCGNYGRFTGEKMPLKAFTERYPDVSFDIMDESFGYNQVTLKGFLSEGQKIMECGLEICYLGEFTYLIES